MSDLESKDYLDRHLAPNLSQPISSELKGALEKFWSPIEEVDFTGGREVVLEQGDISLSLSWTPYYLSNLGEDKSKIIESYSALDGINTLAILNNFTLRNKKTHAVVTQVGILPSDVTIVFDPYYERPWSDCYFFTTKLILLSESPNIPGIVAALFHEAGHADACKKSPEMIPSFERIESIVWEEGSGKLTRQDAKEFLRSERDAWAFALRKLKPFIGDIGPFPKQPLSYLRTWSLHTKSQAIRNNQSGS